MGNKSFHGDGQKNKQQTIKLFCLIVGDLQGFYEWRRECFKLSEVLAGLKLNFSQFQQIGIAAGCDYLKNIFGVGISRACDLVSSRSNLLESLAEWGAGDEYQEAYYKAETLFQHQTVFDISFCTTVPLKRWGTDPPIDTQFLCGKYPFFHYSLNNKTHQKCFTECFYGNLIGAWTALVSKYGTCFL